MPTQERFKTKYPGVYYIKGKAVGSNKKERIYYIMYRKDGKQVHEKAGRQFQDDMTPARAAGVRADKIEGKQLSNKERREAERSQKEAVASKWTIDKLWGEYKTNMPDLKGIVTDQNRYEKHIKLSFGDKEPKDIMPLDVDRLRLKLLKKKAPGTVKNILELLRRIINFGSKKNLCDKLRFTIELPKVDNEKTEDLTPGQLERLLKAIREDLHPQAGPLMLMAIYTGMRRGELFKLKWNHIDFERGFINIIDPKGTADQIIPLNDAARQLLKNHPKMKKSPYIFPGRSGRLRTDINKAVNAIKKEAGLPEDFRPLHGLRHFFASGLASSGQVNLHTLSRLLTHKDVKTTQRYSHLRDDALKQASELAGTIIHAAGGAEDKKDKVVDFKDRKEN